MIRVLIVEDSDAAASDLRELVKSVVPTADVAWVKDRDAARAAIEDEEWDLITCDLHIPSSRGGLDADESHGISVHTSARQQAPGTPAIFATGFATTANTASSLESGPIEYVYGPKRVPLVQLTEKQRAFEQAVKIRSLLSDLVALDAIPITVDLPRDPKPLNPMTVRAAQRFAQMRGSSAARLVPTPGGLSKATPARLYLIDKDGYELEIFMKVMSSADAIRETQAYADHLPSKLQPGAYSPVSFKMSYGLRKSAAIFYTLAAPCSSLFAVLRQDPGKGANLVRELRGKLGPWISASTEKADLRIGDLRRVKAPDAKLQERGHLGYLTEFEDFENEVVSITRGTVHGDLHGENVLIDESSSPLLIDFGDLTFGHLVNDPVTLELTSLFR